MDEGKTKNCPKCRLINPPEAQRCDCGWDFVIGRQERSYLTKKSAPVAIGAGVVIVIVVIKAAMKLMLSSL